MESTVLGAIAALCLTLVLDISKFHLLWFFPLWHYFGTQWIALLYERTVLAARNLESTIDDLVDKLLPSEKVEDIRKQHTIRTENNIRFGIPPGPASDLSYRYLFLSYIEELLDLIEKSGDIQELQKLLFFLEDMYRRAPRLGVLDIRYHDTRGLLKYVLRKGYDRLEVLKKKVDSM